MKNVGKLIALSLALMLGAGTINGAIAGDRAALGQQLMTACFHKNLEAVERLLEGGANVNVTDQWSMTPLKLAILCRWFEGVERLLRAPGINVNACPWGGTPLMEAVKSRWFEGVERLLRAPGINVNAVDRWGCTALMEAKNRDVLALLLAHPDIDIDAVDNWDRSALMLARIVVDDGKAALIEEAIAQRARWSGLRDGFLGLVLAKPGQEPPARKKVARARRRRR